MKHTVLAAAILAAYGYAYTLTAADKIDPRLATAKTAFVSAGNIQNDDQPIAACFGDQLTKLTAYTPAEKSDADLLLSVWGDIAGDWKRMMGEVGGAGISASLPDGTVIWRAGTSLTTNEIGQRKLSKSEVACELAAGLADKLRSAMRKSRDKK